MKYISKLGVGALVATALIVGGCKPDKQTNDPQTPASDVKGQSALDQGDWSRAYDSFSAAITANPNDVDAYYGRAAASLARAQEHYRLAQADATNQMIEEGRNEAAKADEFFKKATDDADAILKIDPNYAEAWFVKGVACQYQGKWTEGIEAFTECLTLDPNNAEAYHRRGEIYDHTGDYMNASVDFKKATELGFSEPSTDAAYTDLDDFSDLNYELDEASEETDDE
ncbi:MAG: tetratricopeptide repeat protein [Thermoguttaceae bacterium]|jgi:tetratricopeptide (TPR) repeat protein